MKGLTRRGWTVVASIVVWVTVGGIAYRVQQTQQPLAPASNRLLSISPRADQDTEDLAYERLHLTRRTSQGDRSTIARNRAFVKRQVIVAFKPDTSEEDRRDTLAEIEARTVRRLPLGIEVVEISRGVEVDQARKELARSPHVSFAEPNFIYRAALRPNDSLFGDLWGLENADPSAVDRGGADIDATVAWDSSTGSEAVTVAVIDTGVAYDHPDLDGNIWVNSAEAAGTPGLDDDGNGYVDDVRGWDWVDDDPDPLDEQGHGTHVAGTIGAEGNNQAGITGVSWDVSIMPLRVLDASGSGSVADVAAALLYASQAGAEVANASLAGPSRSQTLDAAIDVAKDLLFVVAAGNEAANNDLVASYPCNYPQANVLCVAATGRDDKLTSFSNYGVSSVDLAAPGARIVSTVPAIDSMFIETFEDLSGWISSGSFDWSPASDSAGGYVTDSPIGSYGSSAAGELALRTPVVLDAAERCSLTYVLRLDTEPHDDGFRVEVSDGTSWTTVSAWSGSTSNGWVKGTEKIPFNGAVSLEVRFGLEADGDLIVGDGASIDDVSVSCVSSRFDGSEYASFSGTSMAAPHAAGAAALLVAAGAEADPATVAQLLITGSELIPELAGRTTTGARLDVGGSMSLLAPVTLGQTSSPLEPSGSAAPPSASSSVAPSQPASPQPSEGSPEPTTSPPSDTEETDAPTIRREVSLRLARHLVTRGRVTLPDADDYRCRDRVVVQILRNGDLVAETTTASDGSYRVRLRDRRGAYRARLRHVGFEDGTSCAYARSEKRRHVH